MATKATTTKMTMTRATQTRTVRQGVGLRATQLRPLRTTRRFPVDCAYKVTLVTPDGTEEIECDDDTYILDAAEVRSSHSHACLDGLV